MAFLFVQGTKLSSEAFGRFVRVDLTVANVDYSMGVVCDIGLVGDEDDCVAFGLELVEQRHNFNTGFGIQITCGLIREDDGRTVDESAGDGDALALTARKLVGLVMHSRFQADVGEGLLCALDPLSGGCAVVYERQFNVMQRGRAREQVERLEDEPDFLVADTSEFVVVELADELAVEPVLALGGSVKAANEVHQC